MPQETDRLKLPLPLGNETVTRESINGIFEKIDAGVATQADLDTLREAVSQMDIPDASLTQKGKVQLSSKTDGTSETVAATEKAVRDATTKSNSLIAQTQTNIDVHSEKMVTNVGIHGLRVNTGSLEYLERNSWIKLISASTDDLTYFVNVNSGSDSNTGLQSNSAFKTINKAITMLPKIINHNINIRISAGVYKESLSFDGFLGGGFLLITGDSSSTSIIDGRISFYACSSRIMIGGVNVNYDGSTRYTSAISVGNCQHVQLNLAINNSVKTIHGVEASRSFVDVFSCNISNKDVAIRAISFSHVMSDNNSGTSNNVVFEASLGSSIIKSNGQPSGTTSEIIRTGGTIK
ncbi:tail fiber protein [Paenibacillus sp. Z3-2]